MKGLADHVVYSGDVEVQLAQVLRLELTGLELNDDEAVAGPVEEQQVE